MKFVLDTNAVSALMKGDSRVIERLQATLERKGRRIEDFDAAIAAHAVAKDAVLVTANLDDMDRVPGITVEDWSSA